MRTGRTKLAIQNLLESYGVYTENWLDTLIDRVTGGILSKYFLEQCMDPKAQLEPYIHDPEVVHTIILLVLSKAYHYDTETDTLTLENNISFDVSDMVYDVIYPYVIIDDTFSININKSEELARRLKLLITRSNIELVEDPIPNSKLWETLVNTTQVDADDTLQLLANEHTNTYSDIKEYYRIHLNKTHVQLRNHTIEIFNGYKNYYLDPYGISSIDSMADDYKLEWFGNDLWFYKNDKFEFMLTGLNVLKFFALDSVLVQPYTIIDNKKVLPTVSTIKEVTEHYIKINEGYILPRKLFAIGLDKPRHVFSTVCYTFEDKVYTTLYSHNRIIAQIEGLI